MDQRKFARTLRRNMTNAEQRLWFHLRARRFDGENFRRQQPIGGYIVDFVHFGRRVIVEADGSQHGDARDQRRDAWLNAQGFIVLRFWNNDILFDTDAVLASIWAVLKETRPLSPDSSLARGEGS